MRLAVFAEPGVQMNERITKRTKSGLQIAKKRKRSSKMREGGALGN